MDGASLEIIRASNGLSPSSNILGILLCYSLFDSRMLLVDRIHGRVSRRQTDLAIYIEAPTCNITVPRVSFVSNIYLTSLL